MSDGGGNVVPQSGANGSGAHLPAIRRAGRPRGSRRPVLAEMSHCAELWRRIVAAVPHETLKRLVVQTLPPPDMAALIDALPEERERLEAVPAPKKRANVNTRIDPYTGRFVPKGMELPDAPTRTEAQWRAARRAKATPIALAFWDKATEENETFPWRPVMVWFGINEAVTQESHRRLTLPPTVTLSDAEEFITRAVEDDEPLKQPPEGFVGAALRKRL